MRKTELEGFGIEGASDPPQITLVLRVTVIGKSFEEACILSDPADVLRRASALPSQTTGQSHSLCGGSNSLQPLGANTSTASPEFAPRHSRPALLSILSFYFCQISNRLLPRFNDLIVKGIVLAFFELAVFFQPFDGPARPLDPGNRHPEAQVFPGRRVVKEIIHDRSQVLLFQDTRKLHQVCSLRIQSL